MVICRVAGATFSEMEATTVVPFTSTTCTPKDEAPGAAVRPETTPAEDPQRLHQAAINHARIVEAIIAGDATAAAQAMTAVIEEGRRNRLSAFLEQAADRV